MEKKKGESLTLDSKTPMGKLLELTLRYPGLPVTLLRERGVLYIGVLNIIVTDDDWHQEPVKWETFNESE